ncbi:hypothetical protein BK658_19070 [Pseudomonas brassicacearum]|jgi:hypothetical protein|uniref:Uncharacterized protein n=1 Tax=Pseudomonas brassicacearum TaxID=930166 RepID=A0A423GPS7_9PSED|nr:hypothetical protein BK658_19070 [Pseudomonas brassicacearum]
MLLAKTSPASANEIGTCRQDNFSNVCAGINQLVSAARIAAMIACIACAFEDHATYINFNL